MSSGFDLGWRVEMLATGTCTVNSVLKRAIWFAGRARGRDVGGGVAVADGCGEAAGVKVKMDDWDDTRSMGLARDWRESKKVTSAPLLAR
jgi:hypothetical protein